MACAWQQPQSCPSTKSAAVSAPMAALAPTAAGLSEIRPQPTSSQKQRPSSLRFPLSFENTCPPCRGPLQVEERVRSQTDSACSAFEFPIEVERMVSDLCSSSSLREGRSESLALDDQGADIGVDLDCGGLHGVDGIPSLPTSSAGQRGPFSLLQLPQVAPPMPPRTPDAFPCSGFGEPAAPAGPCLSLPSYFSSSSSSSSDGYPHDGGHGGYLNKKVAATALQDLPDGGLSFRELVVKGCLELENILRVHQQHSYIGDLLSFCHVVRESAVSAPAHELDAPSDETRALIIAFFRLVSCWLGLFPCQQELGPEVFREWQLASRRVIIAILRRVPVLRERLSGDTQPVWRQVGRQSWPKGPAGPAGSAARQADWPDADGLRAHRGEAARPAGPASARLSPRGQWRAEASDLAGVEAAESRAFRQSANSNSSLREKWKSPAAAPALGQGPFSMESLLTGTSFLFQDAAPKSATAAPRTLPSRAVSGCANGKNSSKKWGMDGQGLAKARQPPRSGARYDLDDNLLDGAYMKPGCYDVPLRCLAPGAPPQSPAPNSCTSALETTWQAALASAETLCRTLQSHDEAVTPSWRDLEAHRDAGTAEADLSAEAAASTAGGYFDSLTAPSPAKGATPASDATTRLQWLPLSHALEDEPAATGGAPDAVAVPAVPAVPPAWPGVAGESRAPPDSEAKAGRLASNRSWGRSAESQILQDAVGRAEDALATLWGLQDADEVKFSGPVDCKMRPPGKSLQPGKANGPFGQIEQDFQLLLFSHSTRKACAQGTPGRALGGLLDAPRDPAPERAGAADPPPGDDGQGLQGLAAGAPDGHAPCDEAVEQDIVHEE